MKTLKDRLIAFISHENLSQARFAEKASVSSGFANNVGNNISVKTLNKIEAAFPHLNTDWLLTGEGDMLKGQHPKEEKQLSVTPFGYDYKLKDFLKDYYSYLDYNDVGEYLLEKQIAELTEDERTKIANTMKLDYRDFSYGIEIVTKSPRTGKLVPVYNAHAAAGNGIVSLDGEREGWVNIGDLLKDSEGSLYVYGNSMIPGYPPGCLIGVRPLNESFIEPGNVYVVETKSNRYVKRLYYNKDNSALVCLSDNHIKHTDGPMDGEYMYPPFEISFNDIKLIYKVTGVIKRNSISFTNY